MKADKFIRNGRLLNVYTGEILNHHIAILGQRILYVGESVDLVGTNTVVYDAKGDFLIPGFFDAHAHMDLFCNPFAYAQCVLPNGTTCTFNDGHDLAAALGVDDFLRIMESLQDSIITIKSGVPAAAPPQPDVEGKNLWSMDDFRKAIAKDYIISVSETVSYRRIINKDQALLEKFNIATEKGLLIEGHTTGASWEKLNILGYAGVLSCHESLNAKDVMDRLRLGFHVMLRHGSVRQDMNNYVEALREICKGRLNSEA